MARDLCLCAGETQPSLQYLGKQEAHIEASAAENLRESQGEAAGLKVWHSEGLSREIGEGKGFTTDWLACCQEHSSIL